MHEHQLEEQNVLTCYLYFLQDGCCISSSFLLCTRGFYILLGAPGTAHQMAIQACPQCPPRVSNCFTSLPYFADGHRFCISLVYDTANLCRYATPFGLTSEYAHPAEILFLGFATVVGPALTGPHLFTLWLWMVLRVLETVEAHSGYHFPWSPSNFLPLYGG
jgi:hypothetical protein